MYAQAGGTTAHIQMEENQPTSEDEGTRANPACKTR